MPGLRAHHQCRNSQQQAATHRTAAAARAGAPYEPPPPGDGPHGGRGRARAAFQAAARRDEPADALHHARAVREARDARVLAGAAGARRARDARDPRARRRIGGGSARPPDRRARDVGGDAADARREALPRREAGRGWRRRRRRRRGRLRQVRPLPRQAKVRRAGHQAQGLPPARERARRRRRRVDAASSLAVGAASGARAHGVGRLPRDVDPPRRARVPHRHLPRAAAHRVRADAHARAQAAAQPGAARAQPVGRRRKGGARRRRHLRLGVVVLGRAVRCTRGV